MAKDFGKQVDTIKSNIFLLSVQGIFFLILTGAVIYFAYIRKLVSADNSTISPRVFNIIALAVIVFFVLSAVFYFLKVARSKILICEEGLIVQGALMSTEINYDSIDHFDWMRRTTRLGFIPIAISYHCHIIGNNENVLATVDSAQFSRMRKKMEALEAKLEI